MKKGISIRKNEIPWKDLNLQRETINNEAFAKKNIFNIFFLQNKIDNSSQTLFLDLPPLLNFLSYGRTLEPFYYLFSNKITISKFQCRMRKKLEITGDR